ncbi:hypothetical protein Mp_8g16470 [Marchantia polymorpha subsp. ruderalis]|uniref:Uncharacterized protein n=1 Tax=Marchantia polymorpha TaxID=3197 RepID=A0A2R6W4M2_MARPO|nr:hypothetical protein MARPO_0154s0017 [Marchantia polymorpha]BBN20103.1 hypothetical protein Mp_8g16470 [Marchantia polymorpha subsp. ruderalis]|eukprot:PTQ28790.1 hypothetical protein MARPO_0154s0017 [Marchantia polymorpha]
MLARISSVCSSRRGPVTTTTNTPLPHRAREVLVSREEDEHEDEEEKQEQEEEEGQRQGQEEGTGQTEGGGGGGRRGTRTSTVDSSGESESNPRKARAPETPKASRFSLPPDHGPPIRRQSRLEASSSSGFGSGSSSGSGPGGRGTSSHRAARARGPSDKLGPLLIPAASWYPPGKRRGFVGSRSVCADGIDRNTFFSPSSPLQLQLQLVFSWPGTLRNHCILRWCWCWYRLFVEITSPLPLRPMNASSVLTTSSSGAVVWRMRGDMLPHAMRSATHGLGSARAGGRAGWPGSF